MNMSGSGGAGWGLSSGCWGTVHVDPEGIEDWQGRTLKCHEQDLPGMRGGNSEG